jgi:hypothetical protein
MTHDDCCRKNGEKYEKVAKYRKSIIPFLRNNKAATFKEIIAFLDYNFEDSNIIKVNVLGDSKYFFREKINGTTYYSLPK